MDCEAVLSLIDVDQHMCRPSYPLAGKFQYHLSILSFPSAQSWYCPVGFSPFCFFGLAFVSSFPHGQCDAVHRMIFCHVWHLVKGWARLAWVCYSSFWEALEVGKSWNEQANLLRLTFFSFFSSFFFFFFFHTSSHSSWYL